MQRKPDQHAAVGDHSSPCKKMGGIHLQYSNKNYSDLFMRITCGKSRRFSLNFLGGRRVPMCNGHEIKAGDKLDFKTYKELRDQADAATNVQFENE